jgi:hypothetical protein
VNVEEEAIDKETLRQNLAKLTGVNDPKYVEIEIIPKASSFILLMLPPRAGMKLLSIVMNSETRVLFLRSLSSAVFSMADYVSVSVQISALPPFKVFFTPKQATSWFRNSTVHLLATSNEKEMENAYFVIEMGYGIFMSLLIAVIYYANLGRTTPTNFSDVDGKFTCLQRVI